MRDNTQGDRISCRECLQMYPEYCPQHRPGAVRMTDDIERERDPSVAAVRERGSQDVLPGRAMTTVERLAEEYVASTALSTVQADLGALRREFGDFVHNVAALNVQMGVMREKVLEPIREELKHLRYNLGDRANTSITGLEVMIAHLDRRLELVLRSGGATEAEIAKFKTEHGLERPPSLEELEKHGVSAVDIQALRAGNEALAAQNARLIAELGRRPKKKPAKGKRRRK